MTIPSDDSKPLRPSEYERKREREREREREGKPLRPSEIPAYGPLRALDYSKRAMTIASDDSKP
jgi:hypothetical protein